MCGTSEEQKVLLKNHKVGIREEYILHEKRRQDYLLREGISKGEFWKEQWEMEMNNREQ